MRAKNSFSEKLQELFAHEHKKLLSENIKRGIADAKKRKNDPKNN